MNPLEDVSQPTTPVPPLHTLPRTPASRALQQDMGHYSEVYSPGMMFAPCSGTHLRSIGPGTLVKAAYMAIEIERRCIPRDNGRPRHLLLSLFQFSYGYQSTI